MTYLSERVLNMEESVTLAAGAKARELRVQGRDILSLTLGSLTLLLLKTFSKRLLRL